MESENENMIKKPTDEMMDKLLKSNNIEEYIKENQENFVDLTISQFLNEYLIAKDLKKSAVIKDAEISEIFGFQVFSGTRNPSRNTLLSICIAMKMSLEDVQATLKIAEYAPLYPKTKRDSIIIWGINNCKTVCEINNELYDNNEETL
ncbi:MAG: XRE family transcriptional regulator [Clostridia bacterium]|nr:XRE family transcriptional regulator [Clostridia bacterium]